MRNAADPRQARRSKAVAKSAAYRDAEDWRYIMRDARGRRAIEGLLRDICGLYAPVPVGKPDTLLRLGKREVALEVRAMVGELDPTLPRVMAAEWETAQETDADVLEAQFVAHDGGDHDDDG